MSTGHVVVHGAICKCKFGMTPDTLTVLSQKKAYINDSGGSQKLVGNTMDLGMPFQAKTFGQCKLQPSSSGYLPCVPAITQWQDFYDKVELSNTGQILTEKSKATCAIAGAPCVEFTWHGQTAATGSSSITEVDEEIQSQLNPLVNINEMEESHEKIIGGSFDQDGEIKMLPKRKLQLEVTTKKEDFTPLGAPDYEGKTENQHIEFTIKIKENPAELMRIEIQDNGVTHYREDITDSSKLSVGNHSWQWDGFDTNDNLDTAFLKSAKLSIKVTAWLDSNEYNVTDSIGKLEPEEVDWVDVNIRRDIKQMIITLRVNFTDGGAEGLTDWNDVPKSRIKHFKKPPLKTQTVSFEKLKKLGLEGLEYHWGRNASHLTGKNINIAGDSYEVFIKAEQSKSNYVDTPEVVFVTNESPGRSRNWELSRKLFYNIGYLEYSNGWYYEEKMGADEEYKETSAHELGHEILLAYGGHNYSKKHKGSSTLVTQSTLSSQPNHPTKGEIDLMKYYKNHVGHSYKKNVVAASKDVVGLIWLSKLTID